MIDREQLRRCAAVFGVDLQPEMLEQFDAYAAYLAEYNEKVNLTAIADPEGILVKHFEDSLAVFRYCRPAPGMRAADVGTGAGFPAVPLMIACPGLDMTMIEATNKKLIFLELLLQKLGLRASLVHMRGEEAGKLPFYREQFDLVTARAVAELRTLSEFCLPLVKVGGCFAAMKSSLAGEELQAAKNAVSLLGGKTTGVDRYELSNGDPRCMVTVKKISQTSAKYPRASGVIAKKPL